MQRIRQEPKRRDLEVVHTERITPNVLAITFAGESLADFSSASFDDHVKLLFTTAAGELAGRDYTPRSFDRANQRLTIEFAMHCDGVADRWAREARSGARLLVAGPRGSMVIPCDYDWHLLVGDASALPAIARRLEELPDDAKVIVIAQVPPEDRRALARRGALERYWVSGTERLVEALRSLVLSPSEGSAWAAGACFAAGIAALAWTARHVLQVEHPIVSVAPFAHRTFAVASTGGTLASMAIQCTPFLLPLLFQLGLGMNAVASGALLLPYFLGNLGMKSVTTPILKRFGFRRVLLVAGNCSSLSIGTFALVDQGTRMSMLVSMLLVAGCARSMLMTAINTLQYADLPPSQIGAGSTLSSITSQVGSALGVALGALALAAGSRLQGQAQVALPGFAPAFLTMAVLGACALLQFRRLEHDAGAGVILGGRS